MEIVWHGLSCFRFMERGLASVVTDPFGPESGLAALKLKADIVTVSHDAPNHSYIKAVKGTRRSISGPGEFEIGGVFITGLPMREKTDESSSTKPNTLYVFDFNGVTIAHLGDLSYVPSQAQIENLGAVHIALVPVGGGSSLSPSQASEVISLIEPSIVIPMQFKTSSENQKLGDVSRFLKEMGITILDPLPSLKITKGGFSEETQVIRLSPGG
jgi:L-ascorbate metabolism protein UlaG (beta-lactamase superfamily)